MSNTSPDGSKWDSVDVTNYEAKWTQLEEDGESMHGEADFVSRFSPTSVLDAGCGSGRVAIELAKRGCDVVGVDLDEPFINMAKQKAPELDFRLDNLATVQLDRTFDAVATAGNVMIFVAPGTEAEVLANMANHVSPGGHLISGFQLGKGLSVDTYNAAASAAGLELVELWSSWDCDEPLPDSDYAVIVHTKPKNN